MSRKKNQPKAMSTIVSTSKIFKHKKTSSISSHFVLVYHYLFIQLSMNMLFERRIVSVQCAQYKIAIHFVKAQFRIFSK